jgi:hypothetical protein
VENMKRASLFIVLLTLTAACVSGQALNWYKGNTHTHTLNSDGDSTPDEVVRWYREHGYNFVFLTDHEYINNVDALNGILGRTGLFVVLSGQEITDSYDKKPHHVNALGISKVIMPAKLPGTVETLQRNIDETVRAGGIVQVNHPNFGWALTAEHLKSLRDYSLLEIRNGHVLVNNLGGGGQPGAEALWDAVLTSGKLVFGVADDDSHTFKRVDDRSAATPGWGWIVVRASDLTPASILNSIRRGNFYASTGVELTDYQASPKQIVITVKEDKGSKYTIQFIGRGGRTLSELTSSPATYTIKGDEGYVRARVLESNGKIAWTQPVMLGKP